MISIFLPIHLGANITLALLCMALAAYQVNNENLHTYAPHMMKVMATTFAALLAVCAWCIYSNLSQNTFWESVWEVGLSVVTMLNLTAIILRLARK